ncbi:MAG TPA: crotonase/enoyl-CoA hydratase family protein [Syntrophomonadaceae bacterium]|nr:crotonase/enoyl-CoA hydratase family protein [Syntrophomonadaceae bacterium]HNX28700.1 crotonase/enoyl-CoA hydratase family protein [Syntrophomonadaceae bacterium]HPR94479.1 crotonase/enoyl-CoA hydratase family protein [Syntrophomonadaceae bacterium]
MSKSKIAVDKEGHVLLVGFDRAEKRNALDVDMYWDIAYAFGRLNNDPDLRCGLLYAKGDHFSAGLDLVQWAPFFAEGKMPAMPEGAIDPFGLDEDNRLSKPLVMAVQGITYTFAIEFLLTSDIRVAASDLRMAQIEVKRGIYPVGGATVRMFEEIGWGNAMRYILTGDEINAEEAYRLGMVQAITEPGKQFDKALEFAVKVSKQAPLAVQAALKSARIARIQGAKAAIARFLPDLMPIMTSQDAAEGVQAFVERREANFKGC